MTTRVLALMVLAVLMLPALLRAAPNYDQSPFGVNYLKWHYFDRPGGLDELRTRMKVMKDIGIYWDRDAIEFGDVHPRPDVWKWDHYDKCIALAKEEGINLIGLLLGGPQPDTAERRKDYCDYVYRVVSRYKDHIKIWEVWNEPNIPSFWQNPDVGLYTQLMKEAYAAAKKADPACTVIIGSTSGPGTDWFNGIYDSGGWNYCDGISSHPYALAADPIEQGLDKTLRDLKKRFASFGKPKPIWSTEVGWRAKSGPAEERQAAEIIQTYVIHIANGIHMDYFCMDDYDDWGFVKRDKPLETKLAYQAIGLLTKTLGSPGPCAPFQGYLRMPEGVACYVFKKKGNERVLILWSSDATKRRVALAQTGALTGKDILGRPVTIASGTLTVGPIPVIITGADARKIGRVSPDYNPYLPKKGKNVLINPSLDAQKGQHPHGWNGGRFYGYDNKGTFAATTDGRDGSSCVSISNSTAPAAWDASPIPVYEGEQYRLTGWMKTKDATGVNTIAIYWYNGSQWGVVGTVPAKALTGTHDWTEVSIVGVVPRDAALVRVNLISENNKGTVWFDDVTLTLE